MKVYLVAEALLPVEGAFLTYEDAEKDAPPGFSITEVPLHVSGIETLEQVLSGLADELNAAHTQKKGE